MAKLANFWVTPSPQEIKNFRGLNIGSGENKPDQRLALIFGAFYPNKIYNIGTFFVVN
jgi:hypothetical protein